MIEKSAQTESIEDVSIRLELERLRRDAEEQAFGKTQAANVAEAESILGELAGAFFSASPGGPSSWGHSLEENPTLRPPQTLNIEARYRTLVEQIPAVVFMAFLDKGISEAYVSPQIEAMLGFTQEEWLNDPVRWYRQIHPDDRGRGMSKQRTCFSWVSRYALCTGSWRATDI